MPSPDNTPKGLKNLSALNFGWTAGVGFFVCFGLGYWADQKFGTTFLWTITGFVAGILFMGYELWKVLQDLNNKKNK